jgi:hypothetical protein
MRQNCCRRESIMPAPATEWTTQTSAPKVLGTRLEDLWGRRPAWVMATARNDTIYCLPEPAINALARGDAAGRVFLDGSQAAAEREFTAVCAEFHAIGTQAGWFVTNTPLNARARSDGLADLLRWAAGTPKFEWAARAGAAIDSAQKKSSDAADRVKGYTGWLLTEPAFLDDVKRLRALWGELPEGLRPGFPLNRPSAAGRHPADPRIDARQSGSPAQTVGEALVRLLDRWGLTHLATWDLPVPQGPLMPNLLAPSAPAQPRTGVHLFVPPFYPIPGTDDLPAQIFQIQQQAARDLGVDGSAVGLPRHEAYAHVLDVLHLERSILARFPGRPPRGLVDRIVRAAVDHLGMQEDRVRKYRKAIAQCRRGDRARAAILRVTPTARRRASA